MGQVDLRVIDLDARTWVSYGTPYSPSTPEPPTFVLGTTKPTVANTGVGIIAPVPTTVLSGNQTFSTPGQLIENKVITGRVVITAANVTIRNCIIAPQTIPSSATYIVTTAAATNARIEFCDVSGKDAPSKLNTGIGPKNYTSYRNNVYTVCDGFGIFNNASGQTDANAFIQGSYAHDLLGITPDPSHADDRSHDDGVQVQGGLNWVIEGSTIIGSEDPVNSNIVGSSHPTATGAAAAYASTSAIMLNSGVGAKPQGKLINNWLSRGAYTVNGGATAGAVIEISGNRFGRDYYTYPLVLSEQLGTAWTVPLTGPTVNTYEDDGSPMVQSTTFGSGSSQQRRYY